MDVPVASPFHSFPLPPSTDRRFGGVQPEVIVRIHLESTPRFLNDKLTKKVAQRKWQRKEHERCLEGEFASATPVDLSDDGDSCQKVEASCSCSEDTSRTLSDNSCDENSDLPASRQVFSGDFFQFAEYSHMMLLNCNPFGLIAAVIARDSQGSWHKSASYTTHQILEFLEYDPQTCWDEEPDTLIENSELILASESPQTQSEHERKKKEKQDTARTRRILHTLWCKGLRVHDLQCWLPPVDIQDKLDEHVHGLRAEWKTRKAARSRALRFFRSLPEITHEHASSNVAHINVEVGEDLWRGYYRLTTTRHDDGTMNWKIDFNQSFQQACDLDQRNTQPLQRTAEVVTVDNDKEEEEEEEVAEVAEEEEEGADGENEQSSSNDEDDPSQQTSQSCYHLLSHAFDGWEYYSKWNDPKHAHNAERHRQRYEHLRSKLQRLAVGPSPGDADATEAFLRSTCSLSGRVHENALTALLLRWLVLPNDELRKIRYRNRNFAVSARLRAVIVWMLLNIDVALITRVHATELDRNSDVSAPAESAMVDKMSIVSSERLRLWLAILPMFHAMGHAADKMRVQLKLNDQKDATKRTCRICYIPGELRSHHRQKEKPHPSKEECTYVLEAQVREWFTKHEPMYEPIFLTMDSKEAVQIQWPFEHITGWTSDHAMTLLRTDFALQKKLDGEHVFIEAQQPLSIATAATATTEAAANVPQLFTYVGLNHYGSDQTRTFCYYTLFAWPPIQTDPNNRSNILHPYWLGATTLQPSSYEQSTTYHVGNIVYWNRLVRLGCEWLAMAPDSLAMAILSGSSSSSSSSHNCMVSSSHTSPLSQPRDQSSSLLACYRQAIIACLRALWD